MAQILHVRCRHCGDQLVNRASPYCPPCNLSLCYRAMPLLLGMLLTGQLPYQPATLTRGSTRPPAKRGYDDQSLLIWE